MTVSLTKGFNFFNIVNSYTAIGDNNRILQTAGPWKFVLDMSSSKWELTTASCKEANGKTLPVSILYKGLVADGPTTARYRFIKNAGWVVI